MQPISFHPRFPYSDLTAFITCWSPHALSTGGRSSRNRSCSIKFSIRQSQPPGRLKEGRVVNPPEAAPTVTHCRKRLYVSSANVCRRETSFRLSQSGGLSGASDSWLETIKKRAKQVLSVQFGAILGLIVSFWCLRCLLLVMCTYPFAKTALTLYLARSEGHEHYFGCNLMQCKVLASSHQHLIAEAPERALAILRRSVRSTDFVGLPRTSLVSIRDSSRDYGYTQPERAPGGRAVPGRTLRPQDHTDL